MSGEGNSLDELVKGLGGGFVSNYVHSLDPKKRLTIPSGWRSMVGSPACVYVLPDVHHKCLVAFPPAEFMRRMERIRKHAFADARARHFARVLASQSDLVAFDSQGRIRIKDELLEFAELESQVVLVGAMETFELWSPKNSKDEIKGIDQAGLLEASTYVGF